MENNTRENRMCRIKNVRLDIEFQDLCYSVKGGDHKHILKSINGKFKAGELSAILGASGSGKTTLLNILAGYISNGITGSVMINGKPRQMNSFRKLSAYILQEDLLQPHLSVQELMMTAARLKLGPDIKLSEKIATIAEVLRSLGLSDCSETGTERLSGGQKKRLSIALEMISNPPVIFLDEPTSGLDAVSIKNCIELLKRLTGEGRTVISTIHQPSTATLQNLDQVYFIQNGMCIYNGSIQNMISFMSSLGYECPVTYNPADYLIEIVQTDKDALPVLVEGIENGNVNKSDLEKLEKYLDDINSDSSIGTAIGIYEELTLRHQIKVDVDFPTSFWTQFYVLLSRMSLQIKRNRPVLWIQLMHHILCGIVHGLLFYGIGNDASLTYANFQLEFCVIVFLLYTYLMSTILLFPSEIELIRREYFNRWYSLKAYFLALTLRNLPIRVVLSVVFISITYFLSDQPPELKRFLEFCLANILVVEATEGVGLVFGSMFTVTTGSVIGPSFAAPMILLCIYDTGYGNTTGSFMTVIGYTSYLRWGLVAVAQAIFRDRAPLDCRDETLLCYYTDPKHLLKDMGMLNSSYYLHILVLLVFGLFFRVLAYFVLKFRLTSQKYLIINNYIKKILKYR